MINNIEYYNNLFNEKYDTFKLDVKLLKRQLKTVINILKNIQNNNNIIEERLLRREVSFKLEETSRYLLNIKYSLKEWFRVIEDYQLRLEYEYEFLNKNITTEEDMDTFNGKFILMELQIANINESIEEYMNNLEDMSARELFMNARNIWLLCRELLNENLQ